MSKIGYIRVSTLEQNTDRQEIALKEIGMDKYFTEKVSGKNMDRVEFKKMMEYIREGDTLYIESISRLARSTRDLLNIVDQLKVKNVRLVSLKENIDTETPQGKFMLTVFGALAELERENTLQRQKEGIEAARVKGKQFGRPEVPFPKDFDKYYSDWKSGEISAVEAFKALKVKKTTFYKLVKKFEDEKKSKAEMSRVVEVLQIAKLEMWLSVENNSKFVRGKGKVSEEIEDYLSANFKMEKPNKNSWEYIIYVPYGTVDDLRRTVKEISYEMAEKADMRDTTIELNIQCHELGLAW